MEIRQKENILKRKLVFLLTLNLPQNWKYRDIVIIYFAIIIIINIIIIIYY